MAIEMLLTCWADGNILQTFSFLIAREALTLRCAYLLKFGKNDGKIFFPCGDYDNPLNKLIIDSTYLPIAKGRYYDTVLLSEVFNKKKLEYLRDEEDRLKTIDGDNPVWESVSLEGFFHETVNMIQSMSLHPLLHGWGQIYDCALIDDFDRDEFLEWHQAHKNKYPFAISGRQVVNFDPVKFDVHNAMVEYLRN